MSRPFRPQHGLGAWIRCVFPQGGATGAVLSLALGLTLGGCASREARDTLPIALDLSGLLRGQLVAYDATCFGVSVTAADIPASEDPNALGLGITSQLFLGAQGSIDLEVPKGASRTLRLYRYIGPSCDPSRTLTSALSELGESQFCSGSIVLEEIASATTDIQGTQTIGLTVRDATISDNGLPNALTQSTRCLQYNGGSIPGGAPSLSSISLGSATPTRAAAVQYLVSFTEDVTGVDAGDFTLSTVTGSASGSIAGITGGPRDYSVAVNQAGGSGALRLDLMDNNSITSVSTGKPYGGTGTQNYTTGPFYTFDLDPPLLQNAARVSSAVTNNTALTVIYQVSETGGSFSLFSDAACTTAVGAAEPVSALTGSLIRSLPSADGLYTIYAQISDALGNTTNCTSLGFTVTLDLTAPTVLSINRVSSDPTSSGLLDFAVTFSEPVTGVTTSHFSTQITDTLVRNSVLRMSGSGANYVVTTQVGTGAGALSLTLPTASGITDTAGNTLASPFSTGQSYTVDRSAVLLSFQEPGSQAAFGVSSTQILPLVMNGTRSSASTFSVEILPELSNAVSGSHYTFTSPSVLSIPAGNANGSPSFATVAAATSSTRGKYLTLAIRSTASTSVVPNDTSTYRLWLLDSTVSPGTDPNDLLTLAVSATDSSSHSCGITRNQKLQCWGNNASKQLGDGTTTRQSRPTLIDAATNYSQIALGGHHSCAITTGDEVRCWGNNIYGQSGVGLSPGVVPSPSAVSGGATYSKIALGQQHSCAVTTGGAVHCWGGNTSGQLGDGTLTTRGTPTSIDTANISGATFSAVAAGRAHTCALRSDGLNSGTLHCWGDNTYGQLGTGSTGFAVTRPATSAAGGGTTFSSISAAGDHTCGITATGSILLCWGANHSYQVSSSAQATVTTPTAISSPDPYTAVSAGLSHTCGVSGGDLRCWGNNASGQVGTTHAAREQTSPHTVGNGFSFVAAGGNHTCAKKTDGSVHCWGGNADGQRGDGSFSQTPSPTPIDTAYSFSQVHLGQGGSQCGIEADGDLYCWGTNRDGQLGNFGTAHALFPAVTDPGVSYSEVALGRRHSCGITTAASDSQLRCWGYNASSQLGDGTTANRAYPMSVNATTSYSNVATGLGHTCAITSAGVLQCWGLNTQGQLGIGSTVSQSTPTTVSGTFIGIALGASDSASESFSCGIRAASASASTGTIQCWGANSSGQLGDGTTTDHSSPTSITNSSAFSVVKTGALHGCGLKSDGLIVCWGSNTYGQLGNGNTASQLSAASVSSGFTYKALTTGSHHTCGIRSSADLTIDGKLYCWGRNSSGQLGDLTTLSKAVPTLVDSGTLYSEVRAGERETCAKTAANVWKCWGDLSSGTLAKGFGNRYRPIPIW